MNFVDDTMTHPGFKFKYSILIPNIKINIKLVSILWKNTQKMNGGECLGEGKIFFASLSSENIVLEKGSKVMDESQNKLRLPDTISGNSFFLVEYSHINGSK